MMSAIGDAVHVLPVANALKRAWPECRITWLIQPGPYKLVKDHPAIDDFILFRRQRGMAGWRAFAEARRELAGRRFDLVIALQVYFKAGLIAALAPARVKLGFDRARARDYQWLFCNARIHPMPQQHVIDGLFGFPECRSYALFRTPHPGLFWLQSLEHAVRDVPTLLQGDGRELGPGRRRGGAGRCSGGGRRTSCPE